MHIREGVVQSRLAGVSSSDPCLKHNESEISVLNL